MNQHQMSLTSVRILQSLLFNFPKHIYQIIFDGISFYQQTIIKVYQIPSSNLKEKISQIHYKL